MELLEPFAAQIDPGTGGLEPAHATLQRHLDDMRGMYLEQPERNALVYEVYTLEVPETNANILQCTTVIQPGKIGREFHMTKGHFHTIRDRAETYVGVSGQGALVLATEDGRSEVQWMRPGSVHYIPGHWAHRTVNVGSEPFVFYGAWIGDAGHDYGSIESSGFPVLVVDGQDGPEVVENPRYVPG
ncbi:MAG: glucose-6-phosphate isomerase, archaeal [Thermoleophilaceae bacterium]|jgi:glucose-6-phosphate isomerase|nr:glucose-6-phosphate isomerase, archaeal [Thermoleophilaceae bacterium]